MTKVIYNPIFPALDREEFLTPFDKMFDQIINSQFPEIEKQIGVKPFQGTAYPKVNVYEFEDRVGVIADLEDRRHAKTLKLYKIINKILNISKLYNWCFYTNLVQCTLS